MPTEVAFVTLVVESGGGEDRDILVPAGATIGQLASCRGTIPGVTPGASFFIGGRLVDSSYVIQEGDRLSIQAKSGTQG